MASLDLTGSDGVSWKLSSPGASKGGLCSSEGDYFCLLALSPLSDSPVWSELGGDGSWGLMEDILIWGPLAQGLLLSLHHSQCWESHSVYGKVTGPGEVHQLPRARQPAPQSLSLPEVLPAPRWCGGCRAGGRADSRHFAWALPADVYSQPSEEGGSHLYSAGGRGPSCHLSDQKAWRAGAQGREEGTGGLLHSLSDCSVGSRSPGGALLPGQPDCVWGHFPPPLPCISPSIATCPHILGQQLDNH